MSPLLSDRLQPETPLLSRREVVRDIIEWDVYTWSECLSFWSPVVSQCSPSARRVLTVGERNGGISLWFALQGFKVVCSDKGGPSPKARELHSKYNVSGLITYEEVNVFEIPYPENTFHFVAAKSMIGGLKTQSKDPSTRTLDNQRLAVEELHRVLKPGGYFLGAENLRDNWLHQRIRYQVKGGRIGWRHLTICEIEWLFSQFSSVVQCCHGFLGSYVDRFGLDRLTGLLDRCLCPLLPPSWLYVSFIKARK